MDLVGLFFPRRCSGCDEPLLKFETGICLGCLMDLPLTRFHNDPKNQVARLFWGKVELEAASSLLYFNRHGKVQRMLHRLKYKHDMEVADLLGRLMARELMACPRFQDVDALLAIPLHPGKERKRGYNQSQLLVDGIRTEWPKDSVEGSLRRVQYTTSQTRKGRMDRWSNVKEAFHLPDPMALKDRHVLLVDDVVTTGATIEGCVKALSQVPGIRVSLFTVACA